VVDEVKNESKKTVGLYKRSIIIFIGVVVFFLAAIQYSNIKKVEYYAALDEQLQSSVSGAVIKDKKGNELTNKTLSDAAEYFLAALLSNDWEAMEKINRAPSYEANTRFLRDEYSHWINYRRDMIELDVDEREWPGGVYSVIVWPAGKMNQRDERGVSHRVFTLVFVKNDDRYYFVRLR
jgi:hypothetical protein